MSENTEGVSRYDFPPQLLFTQLIACNHKLFFQSGNCKNASQEFHNSLIVNNFDILYSVFIVQYSFID
jgi:hypothetical protein